MRLCLCLCWGLTSQSTIFQSCRDGATASWVINQYFRGVKCLAQGHNTAAEGFEPPTSRSGVRHATTESECVLIQSILCNNVFLLHMWKQLFLVSKRNSKTLWGALWRVKIISLVLSKAEHYVGSNRDTTSLISWAVTPLPSNHFHI